ncbi:hypothetical protein DL89DRAFT_22307 [Linderina pennispora]|uniref:Uncharacterized protein n=1 Tax=Linderina pennispora TaxID=61395 RepID=A0A1Y1WNP7_9FUNG|nr:uncharacterized protein DL89DRAFT_22307 [Linderina pennispora]ORX74754.1 hypothetical protein DL89DRAFT_22307 [Linderina pennispora]
MSTPTTKYIARLRGILIALHTFVIFSAMEAFEYVISNIVDREQSTSSNSNSNGSKLLSRMGGGGARSHQPVNEVNRSLAYLAVLQGIVVSYPRHMKPLFKDKIVADVLFKTIVQSEAPVTVRETLLCMVSNWCILYSESLSARGALEGIVDKVNERSSLTPTIGLLPRPAITLRQEGWKYPPKRPGLVPTGHTFDFGQYSPNYMPQPYPSPQLMQSPNHIPPRPYPSPQLMQFAPSPPTSPHQPRQFASELKSLCDMLTETLISINVEEDPRANAIISEMMKDMDQKKSAVANFVTMLSEDRVDLLQLLTSAGDEVGRVHWLFDNTLQAHNEWRAIQESLKTQAAEDAVLNSIASSSKVTGKLIEAMAAASSTAVDGELGQGSAAGGASSRTVPQSRSDEMIYSVDDSAPPMMRMSSKARGKMRAGPSPERLAARRHLAVPTTTITSTKHT